MEEYLRGVAEYSNRPLHRQIQELLVLTRDFGPAAVAQAVRRALEAKAFGSDYIANLLRQSLAPRIAQPPMPLRQLSLLELVPDPLSLIEYDSLLLTGSETPKEDDTHEQ